MTNQFTFDTFVVDDSNIMAYDAAREAVEKPGCLNPIFIFGENGFEKEHLLFAIEDAVLVQRKDTRLSFVSVDELLGEISFATSRGTSSDYMQKMQSNEYLLICEVENLVGDLKSQKILMHLVYSAVNSGCQVIMTSDADISDLPAIENSFQEEFSTAFIADIGRKISKTEEQNRDEVRAFLEVECPACGSILSVWLSTPEQYPKRCVCGAVLPKPEPVSELKDYIERDIARRKSEIDTDEET